ncbi:hypothetical protein [uncultured Aquimarina sp.]|uniref:hypothetical protein n=1 Tax=uncultured Aquimarina sp. TaxID=575652 RepID=UPI0026061A6B|nr:hypothetical protein [uncultured Aquimarina sp.]
MRNSFKTITSAFFKLCIILLVTISASCENETFTSIDQSNEIKTGVNVKMLTVSADGNPYTTNLMAGQHHIAGTITVTSDGVNAYVTYKTNCSSDEGEGDSSSFKSTNTNGSWTLKATHLYVGTCEDMPMTKKGNPKIGKFPYKTEHFGGVNEYTYTIPLSDIGECFCLAAHAEVDCGECTEDNNDDDTDNPPTATLKSNDDGNNYCGEETAWATGDGFPGNSWAMYTEICLENDDDTDDDGGLGDDNGPS